MPDYIVVGDPEIAMQKCIACGHYRGQHSDESVEGSGAGIEYHGPACMGCDEVRGLRDPEHQRRHAFLGSVEGAADA